MSSTIFGRGDQYDLRCRRVARYRQIAIPDEVLLKPGRLTPEEFEIMKTHTTKGCEILESLNYAQDEEYYRYSYEICRHHHERWDGKGYPDGLKGNQVPIWARWLLWRTL